MRLYLTYFVICLVDPARLSQENNEYLRLPEGFTIGAGGSSYQIEGGWNASDKGENVWDRFVHTQPWKIAEERNGDIADDSYHKYKEDVQLVKEIELDHYRFSISWARILPNGLTSLISQEGLRYYHNLIDELIANDIEPMVVLYHWDHPQVLEDMGGWLNESMVEWFADYANIIFREFGPKVKVFTTINEPKVFCFNAYTSGNYAPGKTLNASAAYLCGHNALKAHARAYHLYDEEYRPTQNGKIGIGSACASYLPKNLNETLAAEIGFQFSCGFINHPIFIGDYPQIVKTKLAEVSRNAGLPKSMLPEFTPEWIEYINGTSDYFGLNHYTTYLAELGPWNDTCGPIDFLPDVGVSSSYDPNWEVAEKWSHFTPEGFGHLLRTIKEEYSNPSVYILENGMSADKGIFNDYKRIKYHYLYLKELLQAVHRDGCNVQKYTVWSLMDNFEWESGYTLRFGLVHVNFSSPNLERVPKLSASWLQNVIRTRKLQSPILPPTNSTVLPLPQLTDNYYVISSINKLYRSRKEEDEYLRLPEGFAIGSGGSSYQIEGGWNASDKGESVWDRFLHTQPWIATDGANGDMACDSFHKYKEDVQWVKNIQLDYYRFSISWSRILPNGLATSISQDGLRYYHNLIDELIANDVEPNVVLYHWDHPQVLEDMGGWLSESMIEWFADYANIIFREFGPKVKVFTTINEPKILCFVSYVNGKFAPGKTLNASAAYLCGHNVLKAHARAYHLYNEEYRPTQNGKIGIGSACASYLPKNPNETLAAEIGFQFSCGWMTHPIFIGDYPQIVKTKLAELSRNAGLPKSMLPEFTPEWIEYINGTSDYFGLNHYTTFLAKLGHDNDTRGPSDFLPDIGISSSHDPNWEVAGQWSHFTPEGFGHLLRTIKEKYSNPPVYVLENGMSADNEILKDYKRIRYHYLYLKELLLAVHRDGCNVQKYTFWSLLDNFEWDFGYTLHFGLIHVNFSSPNLERIPKLSVSWLQNVIRTRKLQSPILPPTNSTVPPLPQHN